MKRLIIASLTAYFLLAAGPLLAQEPTPKTPNLRRDDNRDNSWREMGSLSMTPEMWFYEQERRRYEDPQASVRRKAEQVAAERRRRIAARKWYGYSASRPTGAVTPWFETYLPGWASRTPWRGLGYAPVVWQVAPLDNVRY